MDARTGAQVEKMNYNPSEKEITFINNALNKFNDEKVGPIIMNF